MLAEKKFNEWEQCSSSNDFGARQFFEEIENHQAQLYNKQDSCMQSCLQDLSSVSDSEAKTCITGCFTTIIEDMNSTFTRMDTRLNDFNNKLI